MLLGLAGLAAVAYAGLLAYFYALMLRPPTEFARAWDAAPAFAKRIAPMPPLWKRARAGTLEIGDPAPDFTLATPDKAARMTLSDYRGDRPVVLVFGSYT